MPQVVAAAQCVEVTETCRCCGIATSDWTAVMVVRNTAHLDEVEVTDADPLTVLCQDCADRTETGVRLAVNAATTPTTHPKTEAP